jgi:hypothetical protein
MLGMRLSPSTGDIGGLLLTEHSMYCSIKESSYLPRSVPQKRELFFEGYCGVEVMLVDLQ